MSEFLRFFITICLSVGAQIGYGAVSTVPQPLSHYDVIMERAPFGPIPKKLTPEEEAAAAGAGDEEAPPEEDVPEELPPAFEQIKVTAITMFGGKPAAGFTDGASNKSYYLREGEEFESYSLVNVDFEGMKITLRQNELEADLPLWINPATTNRADISSFGVTDTATLAALATNTVAASSVAAPQANNSLSKKSAEDLEREKRREEWRKKRDEERERRRKELEAMTPEEREQHLRQVNMDLIRSGDGPPLPIELNREEMEQLASEGFAVPGINAPIPEGMPNFGDPSNNRPRGRNRRGGRGFGPPNFTPPGGTN